MDVQTLRDLVDDLEAATTAGEISDLVEQICEEANLIKANFLKQQYLSQYGTTLNSFITVLQTTQEEWPLMAFPSAFGYFASILTGSVIEWLQDLSSLGFDISGIELWDLNVVEPAEGATIHMQIAQDILDFLNDQ